MKLNVDDDITKLTSQEIDTVVADMIARYVFGPSLESLYWHGLPRTVRLPPVFIYDTLEKPK